MEDMDNLESDYKCGYGSCTPKILQKLHTAKFLLTTLCFCATTQGFVIIGLIPVIITTLEKRFHLSSAESASIASSYNIAILLVLVPLSYFGGKGHKGRYLGWGMITLSIGSLIFASPQFFIAPYNGESPASQEICNTNLNATRDYAKEECALLQSSERPGDLRLWFYVLLLGQFLHGIGASPLYTLGITYIDENTSQSASPIYLALYMGFMTIGTAIGFILGGFMLRIYGDIGKVDMSSVHITRDDPNWIGAWWLGFVISAILSLIFGLLMLCFAQNLPEAKAHRVNDINQADQRIVAATADKTDGNQVRNFWTPLSMLFKNFTFVWLMVMRCAEWTLVNGYLLFVPKLVENMFSLSPSSAAMITGVISVPLAFCGNLVGAYLIRRFKLLCKSVIMVALIFHCLSAFFFLKLLISCPQSPFSGTNFDHRVYRKENASNLLNECNMNCGCESYYRPVCNKYGNVNYFSPCWAGCTAELESEINKKIWGDCHCVQNRLKSDTQQTESINDSNFIDTVHDGLCPNKCALLPLFFVLFALEVLFIFAPTMPVQQAELRCVPFELRTLAVGLRWTFVRIISVPVFIGFGTVIDATCLFWDKKCDQRASCLRYDSRSMALSIMTFALSLKAVVIIALTLACKCYVPPPVEESTTKETENTETSKYELQLISVAR